MKAITVDTETATVRAEAGLTWGEFDAATQAYGLAVTGGRVSTTGVAGLALGSGSGWLERKLGFVCDNLLSAEVVTADGRQVVASQRHNADLFWALRGGGGNFGVVTAFHFRLHPVGPILYGGLLLHRAARARDVACFWRDFMLTAPDEVGSGLAFMTAPPLEFLPPQLHGQPVVGVIVCFAGDPDEGVKALEPLTTFGPPAVNMVQPMPYLDLQRIIDPASPKGMLNYWSGDFFASLPDEAIDTLVEQATRPVSPLTNVILLPGGGAIARVDDNAMAFGQRQTPWNVHYLSMWANPADSDTNIAWSRQLSNAMKPWTTGRVYLNFLGDEGQGRIEAGFGPEKYAASPGSQSQMGPDQPVPPEPEHPARYELIRGQSGSFPVPPGRCPSAARDTVHLWRAGRAGKRRSPVTFPGASRSGRRGSRLREVAGKPCFLPLRSCSQIPPSPASAPSSASGLTPTTRHSCRQGSWPSSASRASASWSSRPPPASAAAIPASGDGSWRPAWRRSA